MQTSQAHTATEGRTHGEIWQLLGLVMLWLQCLGIIHLGSLGETKGIQQAKFKLPYLQILELQLAAPPPSFHAHCAFLA